MKAVLFDLDGTLLPMDQEVFVKDYLGRMAAFLTPHGYDPEKLIQAVWKGTGAMVKNDGKTRNEDVFWRVFNDMMEKDARQDSALFEEFYRGDFQKARQSCGFQPAAAPAVREIRSLGYQVILATNPLFPAIATQSRIRWAGLTPEDFECITTYENARFCKPNPDYYQEILGMRVFLLTDCLINRNGKDISRYPSGGFPELLQYVRSL